MLDGQIIGQAIPRKPDKVIYLDAPVEGIVENIKLRGNEPDTFESDV